MAAGGLTGDSRTGGGSGLGGRDALTVPGLFGGGLFFLGCGTGGVGPHTPFPTATILSLALTDVGLLVAL